MSSASGPFLSTIRWIQRFCAVFLDCCVATWHKFSPGETHSILRASGGSIYIWYGIVDSLSRHRSSQLDAFSCIFSLDNSHGRQWMSRPAQLRKLSSPIKVIQTLYDWLLVHRPRSSKAFERALFYFVSSHISIFLHGHFCCKPRVMKRHMLETISSNSLSCKKKTSKIEKKNGTKFWTNAGWLNLAKAPSDCEVKDERCSAVFELATDLQ